MSNCPVCDNDNPENNVYCQFCSWELESELKLGFIETEKAVYNERLRIAKENWQKLQGIQQQSGKEKSTTDQINLLEKAISREDYSYAFQLAKDWLALYPEDKLIQNKLERIKATFKLFENLSDEYIRAEKNENKAKMYEIIPWFTLD